MKVLFITHDGGLYGANRSLMGLVDGLSSLTVQSVVGVPNSNSAIAEHFNSIGVEIVETARTWWCNPRDSLEPLTFQPRRLYREFHRRIQCWRQYNWQANEVLPAVRVIKPDVIYSNSAVTPLGYLLAEKLSLPIVWHLREFCDLDYDLQFNLGKSISTFLIGRSDQVICVSDCIKRHYFGSSRKGNVKVIHNGAYSAQKLEQRFHEHTEFTGSTNDFVFVLVGLVHPSKGQETAIQAFAAAKEITKNIRLKVIGDGNNEYLTYLKSIAKTNGVENWIDFVGYIDDPSTELVRADCALMCSEHEAFGRVTAEAMAVGLPVIGRNSGGTPELIEDGVNGLLYDGSASDLAEKMIFLAENVARSRRLGTLAHEKAKVRYTIEANSLAIYEILCEAHEANN